MRLLVLLVLSSVNVHAELRRLTEADFGANVITLSPDMRAGTDAGSAFSRYGVFVSSYPSGAPIVGGWSAGSMIPGIHPVITNETTGDQAESVLVIDFRSPVKRIALLLAVAWSALPEISIRAFDRAGDAIGTLKETVRNWDFLAFEASDGRPIAKMILDYGSADIPERLIALWFEPTARPRFETVLPQIAHARLGSDLLLSTTISIVNVSNTTATGEIRFYAPDGKPFAPELVGAAPPADVVQFELQRSKWYETRGTSDIAGYVRVVSDTPIQAIAHFNLMKSNGQRTETAVPSVEGRFTAYGAVIRQYFPTTGVIGPTPPPVPAEPSIIGSALAIVNPGPETASVWLRLFEEEGSYYWVKSVDLAPGEQLARFIDELFDDESAYKPLNIPRGTLKVSSDQPVAAILIKTVNGLPVSILPLGSRED